VESRAQRFDVVAWPGPFVGRERELGELQACLADAAGGRGLLVLVTGEPGIGKTRVADELCARARERGFITLWGRCHESDGAPAYWPWIQVLRAAIEDCERACDGDPAALRAWLSAGADDVVQLVPEVRQRVPDLGAPPALEPAQARFRLFDGITAFLRNASRRQPLVIVLDDLHWADVPSLLLLQFLAHEIARSAILVLGTYRDVDVGPEHALFPLLAALAREPATRRLALRGLPGRDLVRYIEAAAGVTPSAALVSAIEERTEGNPFFVGEVVRLLMAEGGGVIPEGPGPLPVPTEVHDVVGRRLARLSAGCREVLRVATVVGREFALAVLEPVSRLPRDQLLAMLEEAIDCRLVGEVPGAIGRYRFAHALVRDTLYASLSLTRRLRLHREVGEVIAHLSEADPGPHLAEVAFHFLTAAPGGSVEKAVTYARRAGDHATAQLAFEEAVLHYQHALEALTLRGPRAERERCELYLALADAQHRGGDAALARASSERAATIARTLRAPELLVRAPLATGAWWGVSAPSPDLAMVDLLAEALDAMPTVDSPLHALGLARLATGLHWAGDLDRAVRTSEDAVGMARRLGDARLLVRCLNDRHYVLQAPERLEERLAVADEMLRMAQDAGEPEMVAAARRWRVADFLEIGDVVAVDTEIERCARLAETLRQPALAWYAETFRAMRRFMSGRFAEGEELARSALAIGARAIGDGAVAASRAQLGLALWQQGRLDDLATLLVAPLERTSAYACAILIARLSLGADADAHREFEALARDDFTGVPRDADWLPSLCLLAVACWFFRDVPRAAVLYRYLLPYAGRNVVLGTGGWTCMGCAAGQLGLLARTMERWEDASRHFEDAIAMNRRMGMRPWVAQYQWEYAAMLLSRGGPAARERAGTLLAEAVAAARDMGMRVLEQDTAALLREMMDDTPVERASPLSATPLMLSFRRQGDYWTIEQDGAVCRLRDAKGLRYLHRLLAEPGREFHVLDLVTGDAGPASAGAAPPPTGPGPVLDAAAKSAYRRRLDDLAAELAEAERWGDAGRAARARAEIDAITQQLAAAVGLGGRDREAGSASERARSAVTQSIRSALRRLEHELPRLGAHLALRVKTGTFCTYVPDPERPLVWIP
jgi:tetratricopeptide (TPR) repeat protein